MKRITAALFAGMLTAFVIKPVVYHATLAVEMAYRSKTRQDALFGDWPIAPSAYKWGGGERAALPE